MGNFFTHLFGGGKKGPAGTDMFVVFEEGSNVPVPMAAQEWLNYTHSLIREPYESKDVDRFIRICEANQSRLLRHTDILGNLVARANASLDAPQMGGQMPPDRLIDYVIDVLEPLEKKGQGAPGGAAVATETEVAAPVLREGQFGIVRKNGERETIETEPLREHLRRSHQERLRGGNTPTGTGGPDGPG